MTLVWSVGSFHISPRRLRGAGVTGRCITRWAQYVSHRLSARRPCRDEVDPGDRVRSGQETPKVVLEHGGTYTLGPPGERVRCSLEDRLGHRIEDGL